MRSDVVPFEHPWNEVLISDVADVVVGGTPSTAISEFWDGNVPWMTSGDVHQQHIFDVRGRITESGCAIPTPLLSSQRPSRWR